MFTVSVQYYNLLILFVCVYEHFMNQTKRFIYKISKLTTCKTILHISYFDYCNLFVDQSCEKSGYKFKSLV